MKFTPRDYQIAAANAAIEHARKSTEPQVLSLPCGAGKSLIISMIAKELHELSGKKILVTAPSSKLCLQDHAKYRSFGLPASVYSASAGRKELRHPVVFGTVITLLNSKERLSGFSAVIIDEAHGITTGLKTLISHMRDDNPKLRVLGLSATCYRSGSMGYIYESHYKKGFMQETHKPYFKKCTFEIGTRELIDAGYLTPVITKDSDLHYHTDELVMDKKGRWTDDSSNTVFMAGKERLTAEIVRYVIEKTENYNSVMFFGTSSAHCQEIMLSLPPALSRMVTGTTREREKIEHGFERLEFKYLVSMNTQLTGVDYPAVDCIALLRKTESRQLFQQVCGRGTRLYHGKDHCLLLDFAENNDNYQNNDIFDVSVKAKGSNETPKIIATCPECQHKNNFAERPNDAGYALHESGYFMWADTGDIVVDEEKRPVPSHFGRRCFGNKGRTDRCDYRWSFKKCDKCGHDNDIAARHCEKCKEEIIDPNQKLVLDSIAEKKRIDEVHITEPILSITIQENFNDNNRIKVVVIITIFKKTIREFLRVSHADQRDKYRYYRDNKKQLEDKCVKFYRPTGKTFYKVVELC